MEEEEERMEGNPLRKFFLKSFKNCITPTPFSFNRNRLDPSAPLSRQWGVGGCQWGWTGQWLKSDPEAFLRRVPLVCEG